MKSIKHNIDYFSAEYDGLQELKEYLIISSIEDKAHALYRKEILSRILSDKSRQLTKDYINDCKAEIKECDDIISSVNVFFYEGALEGLSTIPVTKAEEAVLWKARYMLFRHDHQCSKCKKCIFKGPYASLISTNKTQASHNQKTMWTKFMDSPECPKEKSNK